VPSRQGRARQLANRPQRVRQPPQRHYEFDDQPNLDPNTDPDPNPELNSNLDRGNGIEPDAILQPEPAQPNLLALLQQ